MNLYLWITLFLPSEIDTLIGRLVRAGMSVKPLNDQGTVSSSKDDDIGRFVALDLDVIDAESLITYLHKVGGNPASEYTSDEDGMLTLATDVIEHILLSHPIRHFGFVVVGPSRHCRWEPGNVKVPTGPLPDPPSTWNRLASEDPRYLTGVQAASSDFPLNGLSSAEKTIPTRT